MACNAPGLLLSFREHVFSLFRDAVGGDRRYQPVACDNPELYARPVSDLVAFVESDFEVKPLALSIIGLGLHFDAGSPLLKTVSIQQLNDAWKRRCDSRPLELAFIEQGDTAATLADVLSHVADTKPLEQTVVAMDTATMSTDNGAAGALDADVVTSLIDFIASDTNDVHTSSCGGLSDSSRAGGSCGESSDVSFDDSHRTRQRGGQTRRGVWLNQTSKAFHTDFFQNAPAPSSQPCPSTDAIIETSKTENAPASTVSASMIMSMLAIEEPTSATAATRQQLFMRDNGTEPSQRRTTSLRRSSRNVRASKPKQSRPAPGHACPKRLFVRVKALGLKRRSSHAHDSSFVEQQPCGPES